MKQPLPLILISSPEDFTDEYVLIETMFKRGLQRLHVRKPRKDLRGMERWLFGLDCDVRSQVVVHGFPELADAFGLAGLHGKESVHSFSAHSFPELKQAGDRQYAFLSPIYDSFSKIGYRAAFTEAELRIGLAELSSSKPRLAVYALGGIDAERLAAVNAMGFSGAAILGAVWNAADPIGAWDALRDLSYVVRGLEAPIYPEIESWREVMQERREGSL